MSETHFSIQKERPPIRCEICHQPDQFNAQTGVCLRCEGLSISLNDTAQSQPVHPEGTGWLQFLLIFIGFWCLMCGGFCAVIIPGNNPGFYYGLISFLIGGLAVAYAISLWQRRANRKSGEP